MLSERCYLGLITFCFCQNKKQAFPRMFFYLVIVFVNVFLQLINNDLTFPWSVRTVSEHPVTPSVGVCK